jgi:hypothetical protein
MLSGQGKTQFFRLGSPGQDGESDPENNVR